MKNKEFLKLLPKNKPDSGFTLTELLIGLVISSVVIGAFGFGLIQILSTTKTETSKINARSETSRAIEFITEEIKRASTIEGDATNAPNFDADSNGDGTDDRVVVLALDIPDISNNVNLDADTDLLGSDTNTSTSERVIYFLLEEDIPNGIDLGNWQGPQVLYRWGPPLDDNGEYTEETWQYEALIDGIDNTALTGTPCSTVGGTLSPSIANATAGFYACISGTNTAQLFFNAINETDEDYSADSKVVARSKPSTVNNSEVTATEPLYFKTLNASYSCNTGGTDWIMRTDFNNSSDPETTPDITTPWLHNPDRQPQPINIDTSNPLKISSSPVGASGCISTGNQGTTGTENFSAYTHSVSFTIDFSDPASFNGNTTDNPDVTGDRYVMVYRKGSIIKDGTVDYAFPGYDPDAGDASNQQQSIANFLVAKGYAVADGSGGYRIANDADLAADSTLIGLADNERIIAFEVGQLDNGLTKSTNSTDSDFNDINGDGEDDYYDPEDDGAAHPGFDGQDSVFIISNDEFDTTP